MSVKLDLFLHFEKSCPPVTVGPSAGRATCFMFRDATPHVYSAAVKSNTTVLNRRIILVMKPAFTQSQVSLSFVETQTSSFRFLAE